jgi:hypothetical protein
MNAAFLLQENKRRGKEKLIKTHAIKFKGKK